MSPNDILNIISNIKNEMKSGIMNSLLNNIYEKAEDLIVENNNIIYQITSSNNQQNKEYNNLSSIYLGECENVLKEEYNINKNESLLLFKIEYKIKELNIPIIKFEIFNPINKQELNLDFCKGKNININIPVSINEDNLYKYNPNSDYYNNICSTYTNDKGTDIILIDRKNEYNINNMSLCQINCNFKEYNSTTKKAICECNLNNKSFLSLENILNTKKLLNNFIDLKHTSNLLVMKCYYLIFLKESLFSNIGLYIHITIIIIHIISIIIFYIKEYPLTYYKVKKILENKKKQNQNQNKEESAKNESINIKIEGNVINENNSQKIKINISDYYINNSIEKKSNNSLEIINKKDNRINNRNINSIQNNDDYLKYIDSEMNKFSYEVAVEKDKRSFFEYFISIIKTKHLLIYCFYSNIDYNPRIIKICLFSFSFALYYTINTLFFNDETMHKIYEDEGIFNFIYLLPKIIYSFIISTLIMTIIKYLALSDDKIIEFKRINDIEECENKFPKIIKYLKIKFILFFALSSVFLIFFLYYVSCFCAVYKNTQMLLFEDTLISFGIQLLYPFIIYIIASILRIILIQKPEAFLEFFYKMSKII